MVPKYINILTEQKFVRVINCIKGALNSTQIDVPLVKLRCFMLKHLQVIAEHLSVEEVADIKQMFDEMDVNKNGKLTFEEFKAGLRKLGNQMPDSDIRILMDAVSYLPKMVYPKAKISWGNLFMLPSLFCRLMLIKMGH